MLACDPYLTLQLGPVSELGKGLDLCHCLICFEQAFLRTSAIRGQELLKCTDLHVKITVILCPIYEPERLSHAADALCMQN